MKVDIYLAFVRFAITVGETMTVSVIFGGKGLAANLTGIRFEA